MVDLKFEAVCPLIALMNCKFNVIKLKSLFNYHCGWEHAMRLQLYFALNVERGRDSNNRALARHLEQDIIA